MTKLKVTFAYGVRLLSAAGLIWTLSACSDDPKAPVTACPGAFTTTAPVAGINADFTVEGQKRTFNLRLPDSKTFSGPRPLMVYFHGTNLSGKEIDGFDFADQLIKAGVIVVAPDGAANGSVWPEWDAMRQPTDKTRPNKDLAMFDTLVGCLSGHFEVDQKRIFVSGHSAGGIMTNRILRERSKILAGAVVASGIYDLTDPVATGGVDPMAIMVTFGGDNDEYSGTSGGKQVPKFNFAEQAAIASDAYEKTAGINQVHCRGDNIGHKWLNDVNDVLVDFLLAHPKGDADNKDWKLKAKAATAKSVCKEDAAKFVPAVVVECTAGTKAPDCKEYCQRLADCVVENNTVRPVLSAELTAVGFTGTDQTDCGGCITQCEADAAKGGAVDTGVLACIKTEVAKKQCSSGIAGALVVVEALAPCCDKKLTSEVCGRFCTAVLKNTVAAGFFPVCKQFAP